MKSRTFAIVFTLLIPVSLILLAMESYWLTRLLAWLILVFSLLGLLILLFRFLRQKRHQS